jgi:TonB family protein
MREISIASALLVLGCLIAAPPALSSFPPRPGTVWSLDCCGRPVERAEPKYPEAGRGQSGWVVVSGILDDRGWVTEPTVLASDPPGVFDEAALAAFDAWRYAPPASASPAAPHEVRELLRFDHHRPPSSMPSESGGGGGGGGGYGY